MKWCKTGGAHDERKKRAIDKDCKKPRKKTSQQKDRAIIKVAKQKKFEETK